MSKNILNELSNAGQKIRKYYQRRLPSNPSKDYYFIIRETEPAESILVEYGFADTKSDAERLKNNYEKYAEAVVKAITNYIGVPYNSEETSNTYIVKSGDTLYSIAAKYNLSVNELKKLNNLTSNIISVGQILKIGKNISSNEYKEYIVKRGDTLYSIAKKFNMSVDELKKLNNLTNNIISIGQKLVVKNSDLIVPNEYANYTVKKGDTIFMGNSE